MKNNAAIQIEDEGRGGTIYFKNDYSSFNLWWEFAGGDAIAIIEAPTAERWELQTRLRLAQREELLTYIGEQVVTKKLLAMGILRLVKTVLQFIKSNTECEAAQGQ